jgi:hypothetical protein
MPGSGRKPGSKNKDTETIRIAVMRAFEYVGGWEYLAEMARAQPTAYMTLLGKILPHELATSGGGLKHEVLLRWMTPEMARKSRHRRKRLARTERRCAFASSTPPTIRCSQPLAGQGAGQGAQALPGQLEIKFPIHVADCEPLVLTGDLSDDDLATPARLSAALVELLPDLGPPQCQAPGGAATRAGDALSVYPARLPNDPGRSDAGRSRNRATGDQEAGPRACRMGSMASADRAKAGGRKERAKSPRPAAAAHHASPWPAPLKGGGKPSRRRHRGIRAALGLQRWPWPSYRPPGRSAGQLRRFRRGTA